MAQSVIPMDTSPSDVPHSSFNPVVKNIKLLDAGVIAVDSAETLEEVDGTMVALRISPSNHGATLNS